VRSRPQTPQALAGIKGLGPARLERYGAALLKAIGAVPSIPNDLLRGDRPLPPSEPPVSSGGRGAGRAQPDGSAGASPSRESGTTEVEFDALTAVQNRKS